MSTFTTELLESSKNAIEAYLSEAPGVSDADRYYLYPEDDSDEVSFPSPNIQWAASACDLCYTLEKHILRLAREARSSGNPGFETEMWLSLSDRERLYHITRIIIALPRATRSVSPSTESHLIYLALQLARKTGVAGAVA